MGGISINKYVLYDFTTWNGQYFRLLCRDEGPLYVPTPDYVVFTGILRPLDDMSLNDVYRAGRQTFGASFGAGYTVPKLRTFSIVSPGYIKIRQGRDGSHGDTSYMGHIVQGKKSPRKYRDITYRYASLRQLSTVFSK
jgi:hypothetical protein